MKGVPPDAGAAFFTLFGCTRRKLDTVMRLHMEGVGAIGKAVDDLVEPAKSEANR